MFLVFQAVSDAGQNVCSIRNLTVYHFFFSNDGAGIPGTDSNNETGYVSPDSSSSSSSESEHVIDYLPNKHDTLKITPAGSIDRSSSSIAVAAIKYREIYQEEVENQGLLDGITWEEYKAANRADVKLEVDPDFYEMISDASGIDVDSITIVAYESPVFYDKEAMDISWQSVLSALLLLAILALLAIVVLRSMRRRDVEAEEELSVENLLQSNPEELDDIDVEAKSETRKLIEKFVDDNPEAAAALLRNWLNEDWG